MLLYLLVSLVLAVEVSIAFPSITHTDSGVTGAGKLVAIALDDGASDLIRAIAAVVVAVTDPEPLDAPPALPAGELVRSTRLTYTHGTTISSYEKGV